MKKIVLLSLFGFGCVMADDSAVDLANKAEPMNCECNFAESFNGLYGGLGASLGQFRHNVTRERSGANYYGEMVVNKKKFAIDGELIAGYGRLVRDLVFFGAECRCGIGGKYKAYSVWEEYGDDQLRVAAFRPAIFAVAGMYSEYCKSVFAFTAGVRFMRMEFDFRDENDGFYFLKKRTSVQLSLGARAERQFAQFGNRKIFGQMGVEYTFGRQKKISSPEGVDDFSAETRRAMVSAAVIVR